MLCGVTDWSSHVPAILHHCASKFWVITNFLVDVQRLRTSPALYYALLAPGVQVRGVADGNPGCYVSTRLLLCACKQGHDVGVAGVCYLQCMRLCLLLQWHY